MNNLLKEFENIDQFFNDFKEAFINVIEVLILENYSEYEPTTTSSDFLNRFAKQILNLAESVIDKDKSYPEYRLAEELKIMTSLVEQTPKIEQNVEFSNDVTKISKELMVKFFPDIYNLSGNGFRLLEANNTFFIRKFLAEFYNEDIVNSKANDADIP